MSEQRQQHKPQADRKSTRKTGNSRPALPESFTGIPNFLVDVVMPVAPPEDWKVLMLLWRKIAGWGKWQDHVSLTQIERGAGVCRHKAVSSPLFWQRVGLLRKLGRSGIRGTIRFELVTDYNEKAVTSALDALVRRMHSTSAWGDTPLVHGTHTQKKLRKETRERKGAIAPSPKGKRNGEGKYTSIPAH
jgi:hypothetical protein